MPVLTAVEEVVEVLVGFPHARVGRDSEPAAVMELVESLPPSQSVR